MQPKPTRRRFLALLGAAPVVAAAGVRGPTGPAEYTVPRTFTPGQVITAADLNQLVVSVQELQQAYPARGQRL